MTPSGPNSRHVVDSKLHVVGHVDGVELVGEEAVPQVHPLLLPPGVDGDGAGVGDDDDADDEVVLLQHGVGDEGHEVEGLGLGAVELGHDHEEVRPGEHGAGERVEMERINISCFGLLLTS